MKNSRRYGLFRLHIIPLMLCTLMVGSITRGQVTAVSNLAQTWDSGMPVGKVMNRDFSQAFSFTTGQTGSSYLSGVTLSFFYVSPTASGFEVSLYSGMNASGPSGLLASLSGSNQPSVGEYTCTPAAGTILSPGTQYWLVASAPTLLSGYFSLNSTRSTAEDPGSLTGFSIADTRWTSSDGGVSWSSSSSSAQFAVMVSAIPEPSTYAACLGAVVLGFAALRRRRKVAAV
jgi:hypothetical protein